MQPFSRAFTISCLLLMPTATLAQSVEHNQSTTFARVARSSEPLLQQARRLATTLPPARELQQRSGDEPSQSRQARRGPGRRILGAVVGGVGGFFVGGYTGAWIEGDRCHCDDPGLKGALIGAPVGAAAGGILGGLYLF